MKAEKKLVTSKADKKWYLGNLPPNITSQRLMYMLNAALKKMEINTNIEGDSIISAWISPEGVGHYAFVYFQEPRNRSEMDWPSMEQLDLIQNSNLMKYWRHQNGLWICFSQNQLLSKILIQLYKKSTIDGR